MNGRGWTGKIINLIKVILEIKEDTYILLHKFKARVICNGIDIIEKTFIQVFYCRHLMTLLDQGFTKMRT